MNQDDVEKIDFLLNIEQFEQRSPEWFKQREGKLTSSDAGTALGLNPYQKPEELLLKKNGVSKPFTSNAATLHGQKYEDEAIDLYCKLTGKTNYDFGLLEYHQLDQIRDFDRPINQIPKELNLKWMAGSTDGIAIDNDGHEGLVVLEVKCPYRRNIVHGYCPDYYYPQVQLNMAILDIDLADFIEYVPANVAPRYVKVPELNIVRIHRDPEWFAKNAMKLQNFWNNVLQWKTLDIKTHKDYEKYRYKPVEKKSLFLEDADENDKSLVNKFEVQMFRE